HHGVLDHRRGHDGQEMDRELGHLDRGRRGVDLDVHRAAAVSQRAALWSLRPAGGVWMDRMAEVARVCLIGPQSTGKTTLARQLAEHFGAEWVGEYARQYVLEVARALTADDVPRIAEGQLASETAARGSPLLILDTDLLSTVVYSRFYYGM